MRWRPLLLLAPLAALVPAGSASAAEPTAVGWWTSTPGAGEAPENGFEVASFAGEPVSVAALRFEVSGSPTTATLTLTESGGAVTPATTLQVCTTADPWEPADPGPMEEAPAPDCSAAVDLTRDEATTTWTGDVGTLLGAGSLMVVPGEVPAGGAPVDPGFRVTFATADLAVVAGPAGGVTSSPAFAEPSSGGAGSSPSSSPSFSAPATSGPSFSAPSAPAPSSPTTVPAVEADTGEAAAAEEPFTVASAADTGSSGGGKPWARLFLLVPLAAAGGFGSVWVRKQLASRGVVEA